MQFVDVQIVGETVGFEWLPFVRKAPWLFGAGTNEVADTKALLEGMGGASVMKLPTQGLLNYLWRNRASQKL
jgi:hypothetical protein